MRTHLSVLMCWCLALLLLVMIVACGGGGGAFHPDTDSQDAWPEQQARQEEESRKIEVGLLAKEYVRRFLQFPHDASFPWSPPSVSVSPDGMLYTVKSTVTAKNAFGAELTYDWSVIVSHRTGTWEPVTCVIGDDLVYASPRFTDLVWRAGATAETSAQTTTESKPQPQTEPKAPTSQLLQEASAPPPNDRVRIWLYNTGKRTVEAEFLSSTGGKVTLKKVSGQIIVVPIERLSPSDQEWIYDRARQ